MEQYVNKINFLKGGFRPFFVGASTFAIFAMVIWLLSLFSGLSLGGVFEGVLWHRHEMLFGFAGAGLAGYILTALPNWTKRKPIGPLPLLGLFILWLVARIFNFVAKEEALMIGMVIDSAFYFILGFYVLYEEIRAKSYRNIAMAIIIILFAVFDVIDYLLHFDTTQPIYGAISLIVVLISIIGGRIVPEYTKNYLISKGKTDKLPKPTDKFDIAVVSLTAIVLFGWASTEIPIFGYAMFVCAILNIIRMERWRAESAVGEILVLVMHVSYFFIPLGLVLLGFGALGIFSVNAGLHTFAIGAIALMVLSVKTRISQGHEKEHLEASKLAIISYVAIILSTIFRVLTTMNFFPYTAGILMAGSLWIIAFLVFLIEYLPYLIGYKSADFD